MKIHAVFYVCPECRKVSLFNPRPDLTIDNSALQCTEDGYQMRKFVLDDNFVDLLMKDKADEIR